MINVANIAKHVFDKIMTTKIDQITTLTEDETLIADQVLNWLNDISTSEDYETDNDTTPELVEVVDIDFTLEKNDEDMTSEHTSFALDHMKIVVNFARPGIAFPTVHHAFPHVKYPMQSARFREYVQNDDNQRQKLSRLELFLLEKFQEVRSENLSIHETDVQEWAFTQTKVEGIDNFVASNKWLANFKRRNNIRLRKITKFISKHDVLRVLRRMTYM